MDLHNLVLHVKDSDVFVIFQSKDVFSRPWCLLELHTAIEAGIPIVALNCAGKGYNFSAASDFLLHLDTSLATANPSALALLEEHGVDPKLLAYSLHAVIPNLISVNFNASASANAIHAALADLVKVMQTAKPAVAPAATGFEEWLAARENAKSVELRAVVAGSATIRGTQRGRGCC